MSDVEVKLREALERAEKVALNSVTLLRRDLGPVERNLLGIRLTMEALGELAVAAKAALSTQAEAPASAGGGGVEAELRRLERDLQVHDSGGLAYAAADGESIALVRADDLRAVLAAAARSPASGGEGQGDAAGEAS